MRRAILLVTVIIAAVLVGSSAVVYAEQSDKASKETGPDKAASEKTATEPDKSDGPITTENHAWGTYHWARQSNTSNSLPLKLGDNLTAIWDPYLPEASSDWSNPPNTGWPDILDTTVVEGLSSPKRCRATTGRIEVCNARYGGNWLGLATIWISGGHITKATTKVNDSYFRTGSRYDTPEWRRFVMCQEVGHDFGLAHQDENFNNGNLGTCMDYTNNPDTNQHPNEHDYEQLGTIYNGHTDSSNSFAQTTDNESGDGPSEWGKEIWREKEGRASVFEKADNKGNKRLTHVLWTLEKAAQLQGQNKPQDEHQEDQLQGQNNPQDEHQEDQLQEQNKPQDEHQEDQPEPQQKQQKQKKKKKQDQ